MRRFSSNMYKVFHPVKQRGNVNVPHLAHGTLVLKRFCGPMTGWVDPRPKDAETSQSVATIGDRAERK